MIEMKNAKKYAKILLIECGGDLIQFNVLI